MSSCDILQLPNELLLQILHLAAVKPSKHGGPCPCKVEYDLNSLQRLAHVCSQFHGLVIPLLYHTIELQIPSPKSTRSLYRSLRKNPSVCQHCHALRIIINYQEDPLEAADFVLVEKVVSWVTNVRCLTISGTILLRDSEVVTGFLGAIGKWLREMSHLTLCGVAERPWLRKIVVATQFVALRTINFHEAEEGEDEGEGGKLVLRSERHPTSMNNSFHLFEHNEPPQGTVQTVHQFKDLSDFRFESYYWNAYGPDIPMFHSMLLPHKHSLKSLYIGYPSGADQSCLFRACDFPVLENLYLSRWQVSEDLAFPSTDAEAIIGPSLKEFTWRFTKMHCAVWADFGTKEENWLREFAKTAVAMRTALIRINVRFFTDYWEAGRADNYPWDRMDAIRDEVKKGGLTIEYSAPPISRETWSQWREVKLGEVKNEEGEEEEEESEDEVGMYIREREVEEVMEDLDRFL